MNMKKEQLKNIYRRVGRSRYTLCFMEYKNEWYIHEEYRDEDTDITGNAFYNRDMITVYNQWLSLSDEKEITKNEPYHRPK